MYRYVNSFRAGVIDRNALDKKDIDNIIWGTVVQDGSGNLFFTTTRFTLCTVRTSNIGREAALGAGVPVRRMTHGFTVHFLIL